MGKLLFYILDSGKPSHQMDMRKKCAMIQLIVFYYTEQFYYTYKGRCLVLPHFHLKAHLLGFLSMGCHVLVKIAMNLHINSIFAPVNGFLLCLFNHKELCIIWTYIFNTDLVKCPLFLISFLAATNKGILHKHSSLVSSAITRSKVHTDLYHHMATLGHYEYTTVIDMV